MLIHMKFWTGHTVLRSNCVGHFNRSKSALQWIDYVNCGIEFGKYSGGKRAKIYQERLTGRLPRRYYA